jgi:cyclophilin family peptidyl-prolyl cis-trans isomerase
MLGVAVALLVAACVSAAPTTAVLPTIPSQPADTPTPAPTHPGPTYPPGCPTTQPTALSARDTRTVTITTDKGTIVIEVEGKLSPIAAGNFVALASCGYYDNVVFHRVVPKFVIQGGDGQFGRSPEVVPELVGSGGPPYRIQDEKVTTTYHRGTVAMARSLQPNSVGSQFFIVLDDSAATVLADPQANNYQIIGTVTSGMDVVDAIAAAAGSQEIPDNPVVMTKVTVTSP